MALVAPKDHRGDRRSLVEIEDGESRYRPKNITPLRSPSNTTPPVDYSKTPTVTPPLAVLALNRMGFGPRPGDIAAFNSLGSSDADRLSTYIEQQLDKGSIDDSNADAKLASAGFTTLSKTRTELWADHRLGDSWAIISQPVREVEAAKFIRATHSKRQLFERTVDFWHDHFHVHGWDSPMVSMMPNYDRTIRAHAFGNFRALLGAVAKTACMLFYLDNVYSEWEGPNENYARELLELHTMGAMHYYGTTPREQVPGYPDNPTGYAEDDVVEVTRALTGWSIRYQSWDESIGSTGQFIFRDDYHDPGDKIVLGRNVVAGRGIEDGQEVFDILAAHRGTAVFVCTKLCQRFVADFPPAALVQSAADVFQNNVSAPDQIKKVLRHILGSAEFKASWGSKLKRPFDAVASALRATECDFIPKVGDDYTDSLYWRFDATGHAAFDWHPPNGYPDIMGFWQNTSSLLMRWRLFSWLVDWRDVNDGYMCDVLPTMPSSIRSPNGIVDYWLDRLVGYTIDPSTRQILVEHMAQGHNPAYDLPLAADEDAQTRVRSTVALILMSPEFQWR